MTFIKFGKSALYERLLQEKDRQIDILAEQIDYLRTQLAFAGRAASTVPIRIPDLAPPDFSMEVSDYISDEELDAQALLEAGAISKAQLPEVLDSLGLSPDIKLDL